MERTKIFCLAAAAATLLGVTSAMSAMPRIGNPIAGEKVAQTQCAECHVVVPTRPDKIVRKDGTGGAPDFLALALDRKHDAEKLTDALRLPHGAMANLIVTEEDTADVVAYILSLRPRTR